MPNEIIPTWTRDPRIRGSLARLRGSKYRMVDAHLHVVNFIQETPGGEALIKSMDRANVGKAVIFGLPVAKLWAEYDREQPDYYLANDARCYYYAYTDVIVAEMVNTAIEELVNILSPGHRQEAALAKNVAAAAVLLAAIGAVAVGGIIFIPRFI